MQTVKPNSGLLHMQGSGKHLNRDVWYLSRFPG